MDSAKKYHIDIPHFYCLEYCEGDKKLIVDMDFRESYFILNKKLITHWKSPYDVEVLKESDKERIFKNIREYLLCRTVPSNIIMADD